MSESTGFVESSLENGLMTIRFFHPAHNSLPSDLLIRLAQQIQSAGQNSSVKIIILKSEGDKTFCAGASFDELIKIENLEQGQSFFSGFANVINACRKIDKIVLARVHGKAIGGGVGIAAAADYCLANKWATIRLSELAVGIGPFVIGPVVERKMGFSAFSQLALNPSEWQTAAWAKEKGLFMEVFETTAQLDEYIIYFTNMLLTYSPQALKELKRIFWQGTNHWDQLLIDRAEISGRLILEEHAKSAIAAFKQKS
ncbi:MAG: enoyl-CoA hydratase/isomerase family protein [Bacteroidota bacterium]|nr:enoyl-CoA hydratase/isomerase family protein [Bacteroidota bacterium]